ncbi:hypothetical protein E2986_13346 [Frieseomelitta varia]|uniref:V-type proton ATPase subunit a n=1 Tax=Frieseomelitta varia TaxID=561572 RepID=A0A833S298_9HYME|nr:hypothetical protein E2986_13346 [Frieseomelitta varia]
MGGLFKSEQMALCQLFIQPEAAYLSVSELGETGTVQFRDLNGDLNYFQRKFVNEVRRCDEMERKLRYIEAEVKKDGVMIIDDLTELPRAPNPRMIIDLEAHLEETENDILELSQNAVNLKSNYLELTELRHVLEKTQEEANDSITRTLINEEAQNPSASSRGRLEFVAGVINRERVPSFERMLWRISRGNVFLRQAELDKPLEDPATVLNQTQDHRQRVLHNVAKELPNWIIMVRKMKAIYHTMNLFNMDVTKKCLIGECWVPIADLTIVRDCLNEGSRLCGSTIPSFLNVIHTNENPPTFNRTNKFTRGFQNLIDAYGVASYREANPAPYTIITFPFLFSVMFGDCGHGFIMTLFAVYMIATEKKHLARKTSSEIWNMFFSGRYIILLMGLFSIYTGIIYNDLFSKPLNIFGSSWNVTRFKPALENIKVTDFTLTPNEDYVQTPYPMGMDPGWILAENKIIFLNSYKMKLSIIFGVVHMIFGVCMSVVNITNFKRYSSLFLEFLPQLLFLVFLFFYLVVLMFVKWVIYDATSEDERYTPGCAPSVLITFINMILAGEEQPTESCSPYMYPGQFILQKMLFGLALLCVPVMLFGKPLLFLFRKKRQERRIVGNGTPSQDIELQTEGLQNNTAIDSETTDHHEVETFGEIMILQAIHTIEYVLSTISHTASYLRLWALSLAHGQLSEVLWSMVLRKGFGDPTDFFYLRSVMLVCVFAAWAFFTISILVLMEGLSAFLHTLRLHWYTPKTPKIIRPPL